MSSVEYAEKLGKNAFKRGMQCVACQDKYLMQYLESVKAKVGKCLPILTAWNKGWFYEQRQEWIEWCSLNA